MTNSDDPFRHLPHLREMIVASETSAFRDIDVARIDERVRANGMPASWRRPDADREATRAAALAGHLGEDVWVFAYGSLMWDPAIVFSEVRRADAPGYQRRFCLKTQVGRGSPTRPGLMAALETGTICHGLAYRIARERIEEETERLWRREMISFVYRPIWIDAETPQGPIEALAFLVNPASPNYLAHTDEEDAARIIASGEGMLGRNFEYLDNLAERLRALEVVDEPIFRLHARAHRLANGAAASGP